MKPLRLTMKAFGPYAGETTIDFNELEDRHLFLICGPTGAGKTTILDAMCYALYGKTSSDRTGTHMRSDYADSSEKTEVIFDFMIGDKTYRATRSPEQLIDKKRGQGQTLAAMQASLSELEDGKEVKTLRKGIEEAAGKLIGLNASQFCQVILLPQGDFRKLLVARADEREGILKQLFKTQRFSDFQNELKISLKDLEKKREEEKTELMTTFSMAGVKDREELETLHKELEKTIGETRESKEKEEEAYRSFRKIYEEGFQLSAHFRNLEKGREETARLLSMEEEVKGKEEALKKIRAAKELAPYFDALDDIIREGQKESAVVKREEENGRRFSLEKERLEKEAAELDGRKEEIEGRRSRIAEMNQWLPKAKLFEEKSKEAVLLERKAKEAEEKVKILSIAAEEAGKAKETAQEKAESLRRTYIFGQAAILASQLKEGEPCPVCGAIHHPNPAISEEELPTEEEVKGAEGLAKEALHTFNRKQDAFQKYKLEDYVKAVNGWNEGKAALKALEDVPEAMRNERILKGEIEKESREIHRWEEESKKTAEEKVKVTSLLAEAMTIYKDAKRRRDQLAEEYKEKNRELEEKAGKEGFENLKDCRNWYERRREENSISTFLDDYRGRKRAAEKLVEEASKQVEGKVKPDMAALSEEEGRRDGTIKKLIQEISSMESRKISLEKGAARAAEIEERGKETEKKLSLVSALYNLTRGGSSRITLERYVLGALLDEVTKAANLRLMEMSHHRYSLRRMTGEASDGKGGLTLEVSDSFTGRTRPANTLSGGETFLASLSLALGLADVVQAKQGGIRLDTMFIDEGFGTLDPEALNSAMNTLIDLQSSGRLVGIISHVPELEERIDARLRVTAAGKGSDAFFDVSL